MLTYPNNNSYFYPWISSYHYITRTNNVKKYLVVLCADVPLINLKDILKVYKNLKKKNDLIVIGAEVNRNKSNGIIIKKSGKISKIVEFSNADTNLPSSTGM